MDRRTFLTASLCGAAQMLSRPLAAQTPAPRPREILLANGWHCVNIGDIAHAPGMLRLIEDHLPNTQVTLWPHRPLTPPVRTMLLAAFPRLKLTEAWPAAVDTPIPADLRAAIDRADLLIVGSGGYHEKPIDVWRAATDKPYGAYGVSFAHAYHAAEIAAAQFIYCRDTISLDVTRRGGVKCKVLEFAPDSTFGLHLRDDRRAEAYLKRVGLDDQKFLCVIPRARHSPYAEIYRTPPTPADAEIARVNQEFESADHAALRELIVTWVRATGQKVLACPEMTYQVPLAQRQLVDPLPADVKPHVVWRDSFWLCDEAASVFAQAQAVVSLDCHAPIIALINQTPAIHVRLPSDTRKSQMFADLGLGEWCLELKDATSDRLAKLVLDIHAEPQVAQQKIQAALNKVRRLQDDSMAVVGASLPR